MSRIRPIPASHILRLDHSRAGRIGVDNSERVSFACSSPGLLPSTKKEKGKLDAMVQAFNSRTQEADRAL